MCAQQRLYESISLTNMFVDSISSGLTRLSPVVQRTRLNGDAQRLELSTGPAWLHSPKTSGWWGKAFPFHCTACSLSDTKPELEQTVTLEVTKLFNSHQFRSARDPRWQLGRLKRILVLEWPSRRTQRGWTLTQISESPNYLSISISLLDIRGTTLQGTRNIIITKLKAWLLSLLRSHSNLKTLKREVERGVKNLQQVWSCNVVDKLSGASNYSTDSISPLIFFHYT